MKRTIETKTAHAGLDENGILWLRTKPQAFIDLPEMDENWNAIRSLADGRPRPLLFNGGLVQGASREARQNSASKAIAETVQALAMVTASPIASMLSNLWLKINKPPFPTRLFTSETEALAWLKGFLKD